MNGNILNGATYSTPSHVVYRGVFTFSIRTLLVLDREGHRVRLSIGLDWTLASEASPIRAMSQRRSKGHFPLSFV